MRNIINTSITPAILATGFVFATIPAQAARVYALLPENQVIGFDTSDPGTLVYNSPVIFGLEETEVLTGFDYRPANGLLYGVSSLQRLYQLVNGSITGLPVTSANPIGDPFDGVLDGEKIGIDFNPVVDRIRITTVDGSNLRLNPDTGALAAQDTNLSPAGIVDIAYDRSYPGAQHTTLFGLDAVNNSLVRIGGIDGTPSANGGVVTQIGPLGVDFDFTSALDFNGTHLYAIVNIGGNNQLVSLDPSSGAIIQNHGTVAENPVVIGMAVLPDLLDAVKLQIKRAFNKPQKDSIKLSALVNIPEGFQVDGAQIHLNIGGVNRSYVLDSKGKAALGHDKIKLNVKSKKGVVLPQKAKFTAKLGGGNYVELEDEGIINTEIKSAVQQIYVSLAYGSEVARFPVIVEYTAKAGKSGKAKN